MGCGGHEALGERPPFACMAVGTTRGWRSSRRSSRCAARRRAADAARRSQHAALGLVCGAIAYLLYFRLVADIGATRALTVTYLIPVFGVLWGALFLGEAVSLFTLAGAGLVILGTVLVLMQPGARIRRARSAP
jgi:hypothetical protein